MVLKRSGRSWAVSPVRERVIGGQPSEEMTDPRYKGSSYAAVDRLMKERDPDNELGHGLDAWALFTALDILTHPGPLMKVWRKELGLTQANVAGRAGLHPRSLRRLENGERQPMASTVRDVILVLVEEEWRRG